MKRKMFSSRLGAFMCAMVLMVNLTVLPAYAAETKSGVPAIVQSNTSSIVIKTDGTQAKPKSESELEQELWDSIFKDFFTRKIQREDGQGTFTYTDNGWSYSWSSDSGSGSYYYAQSSTISTPMFDNSGFPDFLFSGIPWSSLNSSPSTPAAVPSMPSGSGEMWYQNWDEFWGRSTEEIGDPLVCLGENAAKHQRLFGDEQTRRYPDKETAAGNMVSVQVPVWRLKNGVKTPGKAYFQIHKALAEEIVEIFTEIYNDPEQFPFRDVGGYAWRGDSARGEHNCGTAIDINANENYQVRDGKAQTGSFWKPGENPYSIPEDGSVVRIFKEHGWSWGGNAWAYDSDQTTGYHDYMHFSYMGG